MCIQTINYYLSNKYEETIQKIKNADAMPHIPIREKHTPTCCAFLETI